MKTLSLSLLLFISLSMFAMKKEDWLFPTIPEGESRTAEITKIVDENTMIPYHTTRHNTYICESIKAILDQCKQDVCDFHEGKIEHLRHNENSLTQLFVYDNRNEIFFEGGTIGRLLLILKDTKTNTQNEAYQQLSHRALWCPRGTIKHDRCKSYNVIIMGTQDLAVAAKLQEALISNCTINVEI